MIDIRKRDSILAVHYLELVRTEFLQVTAVEYRDSEPAWRKLVGNWTG